MRETEFIRQNKEKWEEFEGNFDEKQRDPDRLSRQFVEITDDLSYARTHYPNRSVRVYLNNLAQKVFGSIYRNRRDRKNHFGYFWKTDLPSVLYHSRKALTLSLILFTISMAIGVISSIYDVDFSSSILGQGYIDMTEENIKKNDPMAVYKDEAALEMFVYIALNNLQVAFITFVLGVLFSLGTFIIMIRNGIMVGTFQYFFLDRDLFWESALTIWQHGTIEISCIIIAGGAGLVMGSGLLFPGTYSRMQAFQISASKGLKIMLGITPLILLAAFIEGFFTRYTDAPTILRVAVILISLFIMLFYFIWYPLYLKRRGRIEEPKMEVFSPSSAKLDYRAILSNGDIVSSAFRLIQAHIKKLLWVWISAATVFAVLSNFFLPEFELDYFNFYLPNLGTAIMPALSSYFNYELISLGFLNWIVFSVVGFLLVFYFDTHQQKELNLNTLLSEKIKTYGWRILLLSALANLFFISNERWIVLLFFICFPWLAMSFFPKKHSKTTTKNRLVHSFRLLRLEFGKWLMLYLIILLFGLILYLLFNSHIMQLLIEAISWNLDFDSETNGKIISAFTTFVSYGSLLLIYSFSLACFGFQFYSLMEVSEANSLVDEVNQLGNRKKVYGLEREG